MSSARKDGGAAGGGAWSSSCLEGLRIDSLIIVWFVHARVPIREVEKKRGGCTCFSADRLYSPPSLRTERGSCCGEACYRIQIVRGSSN